MYNFLLEKLNNVSDLFTEIIDRITGKKWKIYLYLQGQCVKKIYVDEDFLPTEHFYVVNIRGRKHLVGTNRKTKVMLQFYKYKMTDNDKKEVHIETLIYEGVS